MGIIEERIEMANRYKQGAWMLLALVFLIKIPSLVESPGTGIDPSWKIGLHLARERGLVVGRDLFFTYGPWGFLSVPLVLVRSLWLAALSYKLAVHLCLFLALGLWMHRRLTGWKAYLAPLSLLFFAHDPEYHPLLALGLGLHLTLGIRKESWLWGALLGMAGSPAGLIKFSMGLATLIMIGGGMLSALWLKRRHVMLALGLGFFIGTWGCGLMALGSLEAFRRFLSTSLEIALGYGAALQRKGPLWQVLLVLGAVVAFAGGVLLERRERLRDSLSLILPGAGLLLLTLKHAFVRQETHVLTGFSVGSLLLTWICLELADRGRWLSRGLRWAGALALGLGTLILAPPTQLLQLPQALSSPWREVLRAERETRDPEFRSRLRQSLRKALPLGDEVRNLVGGRSVDVLTLEVSLIEAWGLRWTPRKVLQSYAAYTSHLDALDAAFFSGPSAPERLLVDLQGLDTRHPLMDAPATWREILRHYRPLGQDSRWLVLGLREPPGSVLEIPLRRLRAPLNHPIPVPRLMAGHLEMQVILKPSLLGKLAALPWTLPEVRLGLISPTPQPLRRIIAATARRPFPVIDPWPELPEDLAALFEDRKLPAPSSLVFVTWDAWAWEEVEVAFFQVERRDPPKSPPLPEN